MSTELTIQAVADITNLSVHTLRYYERIGLLDPISRASSGHRRYSLEDVGWVEFLTRLRAIGMPIREVQRFAALRRQGASSIPARRTLLEAHYLKVQEQMRDLTRNLAVIEKKIDFYKELETQGNETSTSTNSLQILGSQPLQQKFPIATGSQQSI